MAENVAELDTLSQKQLWNLLVKTSANTPDKIEVAQNLADGLITGIKDVVDLQKKELDKAQAKKEENNQETT
ncbi:MAG: hypothetical protein IPP48_04840 [Chitinophagaceae bacterium]|nr:hypothetical protein [Chitinophagaceae bacterium]